MLEEAFDSTASLERLENSSDSSPLFDVDAALERLDGDSELFAMLVIVFQQDSVELFDQLSQGVARGDLAQVERAAHSLKGLSANFDAKQATDAAFEVEQLARSRTSAGLDHRVSELCRQLERLRHALAQWQA